MFSLLGYMMLMIWFGKETFSFNIFNRIKVHPPNWTNLNTYNNLYCFVIQHYNHVLLIGIHDTDLCFSKKAFFSSFLLRIKIHPSKEINMDSCNNLHHFHDSPSQTYFPHSDTKYWCFGLAGKACLSTIFLRIKVYLLIETNDDSCCNRYYFHDSAP